MNLERKSDGSGIQLYIIYIFFERFIYCSEISEKAGGGNERTRFFGINLFQLRVFFYVVLEIQSLSADHTEDSRFV